MLVMFAGSTAAFVGAVGFVMWVPAPEGIGILAWGGLAMAVSCVPMFVAYDRFVELVVR